MERRVNIPKSKELKKKGDKRRDFNKIWKTLSI